MRATDGTWKLPPAPELKLPLSPLLSSCFCLMPSVLPPTSCHSAVPLPQCPVAKESRKTTRTSSFPCPAVLRKKKKDEEDEEDEVEDEEDSDFDEEGGGDEGGEDEENGVADKAPPKKKLKTVIAPSDAAPQKNGNGVAKNGEAHEEEGDEEEGDEDEEEVPEDDEEGDEEEEEEAADELPTKAVKATGAAPAEEAVADALAAGGDDEED
ncbi:hypothetical protein B0H66DRAFT_250426 [Apodospora peruviana]|uniref:Uncharacterized protein n=1 Tax=Apodospora peruviana TaxID=516989 RepID=A0AAE0I5S1_9PEZI|nr:hypothetical protein B0H66DRAFT_250426 [Apodospora peruviana]